MRGTYRNGKGSADHNDRNYLNASEAAKGEVVSEWKLFKECDSFRENELKAYNQIFAPWLDGVNARKVKDGHPERQKDMEDILGKPNADGKRGKFEPVETLLQIGKDGEEVDLDTLRACVNAFISRTQRLYGNHMQWLDIAVHKEKSSVYHAHARRVWFAYDENGCAYPAKKEALVQLGQEDPDLRAAGFEIRADDDRYSNATTRQTEMERQLWYDICKEFGIELETVPDLENTRHLTVKEYKDKKKREAYDDVKNYQRQLDREVEAKKAALDRQAEAQKAELERKHSAVFENNSLDKVISGYENWGR